MLWHYNEIANKDGNDFIINQLPEYLFTWSKGDLWISVWVSNNISEPKESFYKLVRTLDLAFALEMLNAKGITQLETEHVKELIGIFAQEMFTAKMRGELPTEYLFNN